MGFAKSRRALIWGSAAAVFAICWALAITSFGTVGLYAGWLPALVIAPLAGAAVSFLWTVIALTVLLGWHLHASERDRNFG
jgi:hypothetical protein